MKVFCDTNVLVASFLANHQHHSAAWPIVEKIKIGVDEGSVATHTLAEIYAVITRLPGSSQVNPAVAWQLIAENVLKSFSLITLTSQEYSKAIELVAEKGFAGGRVYDALLIAAAVKSKATRIYTFNVSHFQSLADDSLRQKIMAP